MLYFVAPMLVVIAPLVAAWWLAATTAETERRQAWLLVGAGGSVAGVQALRVRACFGLARMALRDGLGRRRTAAVLGGAGEQLDILTLARRVREHSTLNWHVTAMACALRHAPGLVAWLLAKGVRARGVPCKSGDPVDMLEALLASLLDGAPEPLGSADTPLLACGTAAPGER